MQAESAPRGPVGEVTGHPSNQGSQLHVRTLESFGEAQTPTTSGPGRTLQGCSPAENHPGWWLRTQVAGGFSHNKRHYPDRFRGRVFNQWLRNNWPILPGLGLYVQRSARAQTQAEQRERTRTSRHHQTRGRQKIAVLSALGG